MKDKHERLLHVLGTMLGTKVHDATCQTESLHGGTVGDVQLVTGMAETADGVKVPYQVVLKTQKKWERYGDEDSWRREYDLYTSDLASVFSGSLRWPVCYHAEMREDETQLWMEYIDGPSGLKLTGEMHERAAKELGRFQGRMYAQKPPVLQSMTNLGKTDFMKNHYLRHRSWKVLYDYLRSDGCELPRHLRKMLINIDDHADEIFARIERLPVVLCHRDFWVANLFSANGSIILIDWDTAGWGHMGEDIASLIADEADVEHMAESYRTCVPAYYAGFAEYSDAPSLAEDCIWEMMLILFGYRLVEWYQFAKSPEERMLQCSTLQKIYEMGQMKAGH